MKKIKKINIFTALLLSTFVLTSFGMDDKNNDTEKKTIDFNFCHTAFGFGDGNNNDITDTSHSNTPHKHSNTPHKKSKRQKPEFHIAYGKADINTSSCIISTIKSQHPDAEITKIDIDSFDKIKPRNLMSKISQIKNIDYVIINQTKKMRPAYPTIYKMGQLIKEITKNINRKIKIIFIIKDDIKLINKEFTTCQEMEMLIRHEIFKKNRSYPLAQKNFLEQFDKVIPVPHMETFTYEFDKNFDSSKKELINLDCENIKHSGALKDKYDYLNYITGRDLKRDLSKNKDIDYLTDCLYFAKKMGHDTIFEKVLTAFNTRYLKKDDDQHERIEFLKKNTCNQKMLNKKIKLKNKNFETFKFLFV